jgi:hypothetical protein
VPFASLEEVKQALARYQKLAQLAESFLDAEAKSEQYEAIGEELG